MEELINEYTCVRECDYKGEHYSVRDNGSVMRHSRRGLRVRSLDNKWTFGRKDEKTGYMFFSGQVRVHQIVATAFCGIPEDKYMVVDHIDTNKCNNRQENLRWVTRLENVLNNPITRKRIILCCGSIETFLDDPSVLRERASEPNTKWMRTVSKEEAQKCRRNLERWALDDRRIAAPTKRTDEGVFKSGGYDAKPFETEGYEERIGSNMDKSGASLFSPGDIKNEVTGDTLTQSLTKNAVQVNWKTPSLFPLCPTIVSDTPLRDYVANLAVGKVFCINKYNSESKIVDFGISEDGESLVVLCYNDGVKGGMGGWTLATITAKEGVFHHKNEGSFFEEDGGRKYFTLALGKEWTGGDVFDDYC